MTQGDIIGIYDSNGNVVEYTYDSWGKLISITGSLADTVGIKNPLRYRGYYYDTETSLYYLQSRYYDPETCRFINMDAYFIAGDYLVGKDMYAYCLNNPVMYSDPTGYDVNGEPNSSEQAGINIVVGLVGAHALFELAKEFDMMGFVNVLLYQDGTPNIVGLEFIVIDFEITKFWAEAIEDVGNFAVDYASTALIAILGILIGGPITGGAAGIIGHIGKKAIEKTIGNIFQLVSPGEYALFKFYLTLDKGKNKYELIEFSVLKYIGKENKGFSTFEWFGYDTEQF